MKTYSTKFQIILIASFILISGIVSASSLTCVTTKTLKIHEIDPLLSKKNLKNVKFTSFNAYSKKDFCRILWSTSRESNNKGFLIQRSHDGKSWDKVVFVHGQVKSYDYVDYEYIDFSPLDGNSYYRLKQINLDGTYNLTRVAFVHCKLKKKNARCLPYSNMALNIHN